MIIDKGKKGFFKENKREYFGGVRERKLISEFPSLASFLPGRLDGG